MLMIGAIALLSGSDDVWLRRFGNGLLKSMVSLRLNVVIGSGKRLNIRLVVALRFF